MQQVPTTVPTTPPSLVRRCGPPVDTMPSPRPFPFRLTRFALPSPFKPDPDHGPEPYTHDNPKLIAHRPPNLVAYECSYDSSQPRKALEYVSSAYAQFR